MTRKGVAFPARWLVLRSHGCIRLSAGAALGQRPRLRSESRRAGGQALRRAAGVHHPLHATAEWDDRAILPDAEAGMRVAASLREPRPRVSGRGGVARSLRHRAAPLGARISDAEGVPREISGLRCTETRGTPQSLGPSFVFVP